MENFVFNKKNNSIQKIDKALKKEKNSLIQNNIYSIDKYLICPKCNVNIPSLPFFINPIESGSIEILINCKCGNKDRMPLEDYFKFKISFKKINMCEECNSNNENLNCLYCIDCSKWICDDCRKNFDETEKTHNYSKYPVIFSEFCDIHINYEKLFYCLTCKEDLCIKCLYSHQKNHKIINLIEYYNKVKELYSIKNIENRILEFNKKNEELKNKCLENFEKIENEFEIISNETDNDFKDIKIEKESFLELYFRNITLNQQLNKLIHTLYDIFVSSKEHPNYNIIHNLEICSYINDKFPNIENENENKSNYYYLNMYKKIYKFFKENHLLSIKSLLLMKEEKIYLDNYNINHLLKLNEEFILLTTYSSFYILNTKTKELSPIIEGHDKEITKIIKLKNGNIVSGSKDGLIKIWNFSNSLSLINSLFYHEDEIIELLELSDKNLLSMDKNGKMIICDINEFNQIQIFSLNSNILNITELTLSEYFVITDQSFFIFQNNKKIIKKNFNITKIISSLFLKSQLICCTDNNMIYIYDINPLKEIKTLRINNIITTIKQFNDKYIYGVSVDYNLYFFKLENFEQISCVTIKTYNFYEILYMNEYFAYFGSNNGLIEFALNINDLIDDYVDNIVLI